eukprot:9030359-Karenia_brevis.AAC.1
MPGSACKLSPSCGSSATFVQNNLSRVGCSSAVDDSDDCDEHLRSAEQGDTDREAGPAGEDEAGDIVPGSRGAEVDNIRGGGKDLEDGPAGGDEAEHVVPGSCGAE